MTGESSRVLQTMSLETARKKLSHAVVLMATSTRSLQDRLESSYWLFAMINGPSAETTRLPQDLQSEYDAVVRELTKVPAQGNEDPVAATVRRMGDGEAKQLIERVVRLCDGVARRLGPAE
jgi:hypothetical protein